ncbi:MAG: glycosyltransferase [Lachnospiraceae bacterium]|nr:glycosyltransferase [Lachnospiraceae bacterium]
MKISVVTVCYNEKNTIRETVESVLAQKYDDYEYIIMDGASTDGTLDIIKEYADNPKMKYMSEPDTGLFNAMNKSLTLVSGQYVIFMNSGDLFLDENVLADVAPYLREDIVYGDVLRRTKEGSYIQKYKGTHWERIRMMLCGLAFCHQTQFTKTEVMKRYGFREDHKITADFDFVVRALSDKRSFKHVDRVICSFDHDGGISADKSNYLQMVREDDSSIRECFPLLYYVTIIPKRLFRLWFRR